MASEQSDSELIVLSAVHGHHIYKEVWNPIIGEVLNCEHEADNQHNGFAIACKKQNGIIVGHLPRTDARTFYHFLAHDGTITATIKGPRRYCREAGGMEVPCELIFTGKRKHIKKLEGLISDH